MTLREARVAFTWQVARLLVQATKWGYEPALDEVKRDPRVAVLNAQSGKGIAESVHLLGLAVDLLLYRDGKYLTDSEDYRRLGSWWKAQHPLARWGGDFKRVDGNHFSFTWNGRS